MDTKNATVGLISSLKRPLQWALLAGVGVALASLSMPNHYRSEAKLLPVESKGLSGSLGGLASAAAAFGVSVPGGEGTDANFVDVLNSRWLREQLVSEKFEYHHRTWRFGSEHAVRGTLYDYFHVSNQDQALRALGSVLLAAKDVKTKVLTISAETTSPDLSQRLVVRATKLLEKFYQEKGRTRGGAKVAFAEARLVEARKELDQAEDAFQHFLQGNRNYQVSPDPTVRLKGAKLEGELKLRQQLVTGIAMNREQALLEERNDMPILNVMDAGNLPLEKSKPGRANMVLGAMFLVGLLAWGAENQARVKSFLLSE